jgi:hypothetical protein
MNSIWPGGRQTRGQCYDFLYNFAGYGDKNDDFESKYTYLFRQKNELDPA